MSNEKKAGVKAQLKSFLSAPMRFGMLPRNAQIISLDKDFPWNESDMALPWRHCVSCCKTMVWRSKSRVKQMGKRTYGAQCIPVYCTLPDTWD